MRGVLMSMNEHTEVRTGFGVRPAQDEYLGNDSLRELMNSGFEPRTVWRTIPAWQLAPDEYPLRQQDSWRKRTKYVAGNPETIERLFQERDAEFDWKGVHFMVVFDGLDRRAEDWNKAGGHRAEQRAGVTGHRKLSRLRHMEGPG